MIFQCNDLERALRFPELMPDAREHAERCPACRQQLYVWSEISRLAPSLHQEWDSPSLWPAIRERMASEVPSRRGFPVWRWALAAAALVTLAVSLSIPGRSKSPDFLTEDALRDVQQAESAYVQSIARLSKIAGTGLEQSHEPLADAYREKLALLDSAIADLQANLEHNRYNVYLQNQLASLYREKQKTLQDWLKNGK